MLIYLSRRSVRGSHCVSRSTDSERRLVVLRLQADRILRHFLFHLAEEGKPADLPPRIPPFNDVLALVDWNQMGA